MSGDSGFLWHARALREPLSAATSQARITFVVGTVEKKIARSYRHYRAPPRPGPKAVAAAVVAAMMRASLATALRLAAAAATTSPVDGPRHGDDRGASSSVYRAFLFVPCACCDPHTRRGSFLAVWVCAVASFRITVVFFFKPKQIFYSSQWPFFKIKKLFDHLYIYIYISNTYTNIFILKKKNSFFFFLSFPP